MENHVKSSHISAEFENVNTLLFTGQTNIRMLHSAFNFLLSSLMQFFISALSRATEIQLTTLDFRSRQNAVPTSKHIDLFSYSSSPKTSTL